MKRQRRCGERFRTMSKERPSVVRPSVRPSGWKVGRLGHVNQERVAAARADRTCRTCCAYLYIDARTVRPCASTHLQVGGIELAILRFVLGIAHESYFLVSPSHRADAHIVGDLEFALLQHAPAAM